MRYPVPGIHNGRSCVIGQSIQVPPFSLPMRLRPYNPDSLTTRSSLVVSRVVPANANTRITGGQSIGAVSLRSRGCDPRSWVQYPMDTTLRLQACSREQTPCNCSGLDQRRPGFRVAGVPAARLQAPSVIRGRVLIEKAFGFPCASKGEIIGVGPLEPAEREAAPLEERAR